MQNSLDGLLQSACDAELMVLHLSFVKRGVCKLSPGKRFRIEHAEHDAAPFDEIDRAHEPGAGREILRSRKCAKAALDEAHIRAQWHRYSRLTEEISEHPRGIVPACVLKVEKYDAAIA